MEKTKNQNRAPLKMKTTILALLILAAQVLAACDRGNNNQSAFVVQELPMIGCPSSDESAQETSRQNVRYRFCNPPRQSILLNNGGK